MERKVRRLKVGDIVKRRFTGDILMVKDIEYGSDGEPTFLMLKSLEDAGNLLTPRANLYSRLSPLELLAWQTKDTNPET